MISNQAAKEIVQRWQCNLCGQIYEGEKPPIKCEKCNCPSIRDVTDGYLDNVSPESVQHLLKPMTNCERYTIDPASNQKVFHPLKLKLKYEGHVIPERIMFERSFIRIWKVCAACGHKYESYTVLTRRILRDPKVQKQLEKHKAALTEAEIIIPGFNGPEVPQEAPPVQVASP